MGGTESQLLCPVEVKPATKRFEIFLSLDCFRSRALMSGKIYQVSAAILARVLEEREKERKKEQKFCKNKRRGLN